MSITRANMLTFREECLRELNSRNSVENEAGAIKIAILMANNNGFTKYQSLPTNYDEHIFQLIVSYLANIFVDSSVTFLLEEETGKRTVVVDWSGTVNVVTNPGSSEVINPASSSVPNLELNVELIG